MSAIRWPLTYNVIRRGMVNHTFGMVRNGGTKPHGGWDFFAAPGTPCYAITDGVISHIYCDPTGFGNVVVLKFKDNNEDLYAAYCHLSRNFVKTGSSVAKGERLGLTGATGNARGLGPLDEHLHFEIRTFIQVRKGLDQRRSPLRIFKVCPLKKPILDPI